MSDQEAGLYWPIPKDLYDQSQQGTLKGIAFALPIVNDLICADSTPAPNFSYLCRCNWTLRCQSLDQARTSAVIGFLLDGRPQFKARLAKSMPQQ